MDLELINLGDMPDLEQKKFGFTITSFENNNGKKFFKYNGSSYKYGDELIKLINGDFSKVNTAFNKIELKYEKEAINLNTLEISISEFFSPLFKLSSTSLYVRLFKEYISSLIELDPVADEDGNKILYKYSDLLKLCESIRNNFFISKKKYTRIFDECFSKKGNFRKNKDLNVRIQNKINILNTGIDNRFITQIPDIVENLKKITSTYIEKEITFSNIESFCKHEFIMLLQMNSKICKCKFCNKFFFADTNYKTYCSSKCRKLFNDNILNLNPYFCIYRKKYKNIYNYRENAKLSQVELEKRNILFNLNSDARDKLGEIYREYKAFNTKPIDEDIMKEYTKKLDDVLKDFKRSYKTVTSVTKS